jgi:adenylate cyclase
VADAGVVERKLAAIFAADVVDYSRLMGRNEVGTLRALQARRTILDGLIAAHRGRIFTTAGDSVLADFASAVEAVECAVAVQAAMARENAETTAGEPMRFRIGVHLGDVIVEGENLFGDGINIAARLQALAEPGGICVSSAVREQVGDRLPIWFGDLGAQTVKNIAVPVRAFRIESGGERGAAAGNAGSLSRRVRIAVSATVAVVLLAIIAGGWWLRPGAVRPEPAAAPGPDAVQARPSATEPAPRLSMVVLPFVNLGNDPDQDYFADGVTEDLTTDLSRLAGSLVIARNTAFTYKGKAVDAKQVGRELGVRYVVEGSVRRSGDQVRVNIQLVDAESGAHLWADRFDRKIGELFSLQNEITARIARAVQAQLAIAEAGRPIAHPDALDYVLHGRAELQKPISRDNYDAAAGDFEKALSIDPRVPDGRAWLAAVLAVRVLDELSEAPDEELRRAERLVSEALATAPGSALAHHVKGQVLRARGRCAEAIPEYEAAIAIDRSRAPTWAHIGWCKFLTGAVDEAMPYFEEAIRLSPNEPSIAAWYGRLGVVHLLEGDVGEAIRWLDKATNTNPRLPFVHAYLAAAYGLQGDAERAHAALARAQGLSDSYGNLARVKKSNWYDNPKIRAMAETTYFAGLRRAGLPEV